MLMGLAIECALSRAERQNMLINDLHLTPMQSTALHFFWTEKYKKNQKRKRCKNIFCTSCQCACMTDLVCLLWGNFYYVGYLCFRKFDRKTRFCKKSFSLSSLWHFAALHHLHLVCISFAHNFQIIIIKEKPLQQITLNLRVTYVCEKKHPNLH